MGAGSGLATCLLILGPKHTVLTDDREDYH